MRNVRIRPLLSIILLVSVLQTSGCGYILHPERRKAHSTRIDPLTVTFDCLWLLAGVIPGVVALIVDGVKETWYFAPGEKAGLEPRSQDRLALEPGSTIEVRIEGLAAEDAEVTLSLVASDGGRVLAESRAAVEAGRALGPIALRVPTGAGSADATLVLDVDGQRQLSRRVCLGDSARP